MVSNEKLTIDYIKSQMSAERFENSLCVAENARKIATIHGENADNAETAGLLHDLAREWKNDDILKFLDDRSIPITDEKRNLPVLLHGNVAAIIIHDEFGIDNQNIIEAVNNHTLGAKNMSALEKIIFLSDTLASVGETDSNKYQLIFDTAARSLEIAVELVYQLTDRHFQNNKIKPAREFFENWNANKTK